MGKLNFKKIVAVCFLCIVMAGSFWANNWAGVFAYAKAESNVGGQKINEEEQSETEKVSQQTETKTKENCIPENCYIQTSESAAVSLESEIFEENEPVRVSFFAEDATDYYFESAGISVGENVENEDGLQVELLTKEQFGQLNVYYKAEGEDYRKSSVYTYRTTGKVFVSELTRDDAWRKGLEYLHEQDIISYEELERQYNDYANEYGQIDEASEESSEEPVAIQPLSSNDKTTYAKGRLRIELEDGTRVPLKYVLVCLMDREPNDGCQILKSGKTDAEGYFSFEFQNADQPLDFEGGGYDIFIRWYSASSTFKFAPDWAFTFPYYTQNMDDNRANVETGTTHEFYYFVPYNENSDIWRTMYMTQAMVVGQRFLLEKVGSCSKVLEMAYPGTSTSFSFQGLGGIYAEDYKNWDTLVHEYGHFAEYIMGTYPHNLLDVILHDTSHEGNDDQFVEKPGSKHFAMSLVWSEAWATAFAFIAQDYYKSEYTDITYAGDARYNTGTNYETFYPRKDSGEVQENAVIAFLWDLFDPYSASEPKDNMTLSHFGWFEMTTKSKIYTLTGFANVIETSYPAYRSQIGALLEIHQISPSNLTVTNSASVSALVAPILTWKVNGSQNNPLNRFQVAFYNSAGILLYETVIMESERNYDETFEYSVSAADWKEVLKNLSGIQTIHIAVKGYHDTIEKNPALPGGYLISSIGFLPSQSQPEYYIVRSGPYASAYKTVFVDTFKRNLTITASNRYTEEIISLKAKEYREYTVIFKTTGNKIIQTFGTADTKLYVYDANGNLIKEPGLVDDKGYKLNAFISYHFTKDIRYKIKVDFFSPSATGTIKLAINPAWGARATGLTALEKYEDIYNVSEENWSWNTYAEQYYTRMITFTPKITGSYTIELESIFDTYLYIIDPRSTAMLIENIDYNDDHYVNNVQNLNARLMKNLEAGIPYLIIYSAYNPSRALENLDEGDDILLKINKN